MSIISNLLARIGVITDDVRADRAKYILTWYRKPGTDEDVWEAHTALERLEEITRREIAAGDVSGLEESEEWLLANAGVAEAMSCVSWLQEWKIRDAVAAGIPAADL